MHDKIPPQHLSKWQQQLHPEWLLNEGNNLIFRNFSFHDYYQTMAFANSVAWIAHQHDHHPDLHISYRHCRVDYTTHAVAGLTQLDFDCAQAIDRLVSE